MLSALTRVSDRPPTPAVRTPSSHRGRFGPRSRTVAGRAAAGVSQPSSATRRRRRALRRRWTSTFSRRSVRATRTWTPPVSRAARAAGSTSTDLAGRRRRRRGPARPGRGRAGCRRAARSARARPTRPAGGTRCWPRRRTVPSRTFFFGEEETGCRPGAAGGQHRRPLRPMPLAMRYPARAFPITERLPW